MILLFCVDTIAFQDVHLVEWLHSEDLHFSQKYQKGGVFMGDTIIFMSAYETTKYSKSKLPFKKKPKLDTLLDKHHLTYMLMDNKLISSKGALKLCAEYDYIQQSTSFSFTPINEKRDIDDFEEIVKRTWFCVKLLHAQSVLADSLYFNIDYFICMESFLVHIV